MAKPLEIQIKESIPELRTLQRRHGKLIGSRLRVLIAIKKHEKTGISKRDLSALTGVNHNSIVKWRLIYKRLGLSPLLVHGRKGGFKKSILSKEEHKQIEKVLKTPTNNIRGYTELLDWVKKELNKDMKYITLLKYSQRHFGSKIKVARKRHIKKDEQAAEAFKKTSVKNARS